ncbi:MAG: hypothetical protein LAT53_09315 [Idiomarina sp.]|nr:hypothetical protein [Idiomarina sp.]
MHISRDPFVQLWENFLESELGVGFERDAIRTLNDVTEDQLNLFNSQLRDVDQARHHEMVIKDIYGGHSQDDVVESAIDRPYSAMFTHPYNGLETPSLDELKRQLLFFNRIAIVVPQARLNYGDIGERRKNFERLMKSYLDIKPLVEQGSVALLPMSGFYSNEIEGGAGIIRRACLEDHNVKEWIDGNQEVLNEFSNFARKGDPFFDAGVRIASAVSYGHRLAATHPFVGGLYAKLFGDEGQTPNLSHIETLRNLKSIHLPGLGGFDWDDLVSIRRDEDMLEEWRVNLDAAISSVNPYLPPEQFVERFNAEVPAKLEQAARELDRRLKGSSSLNKFRGGVSEIAVSAVAAFFTGNPVGPIEKVWENMRTVSEAEGAKQALRFLWATKERSSGDALRSHYAVFRTRDRKST